MARRTVLVPAEGKMTFCGLLAVEVAGTPSGRKAQTQAFVAEQGAAAAEFRFQLDLVDYQRAISWFQDDKTTQQVGDLILQIEQLTGQ